MKLLQAEAGVNDGKAGLLSAAGLFSKAGVFDKKSESFNILELDPYLLFDARESMLGTLENPTLDLDPATPSTLDVITATRSGTATYTDVNGNIATAAADTVRVDYVDGVPMMLIEPSATNLLPYSEDFSNAGWTKQYDVVVTSSSVTSPDGTTNAFKITGLESTDGDVGLIERVGASASTTYTFSAYLKALDNDDVGKKVRIRLKRNGGALVTSNQQVVLSSEWVRHSVSITLLSDNTGVDSTITKDDSSPTVERADECLIWGAQLEESSVPTSYIPTLSGSTVTRAADDLVISGSDFSDFFNGSEGTFYIEAVDRQATGSSHAYLAGQSTSQFFIYKNAGSTQIYNLDGTNILDLGQVVSNQLFRAAVTYKTGVSPAPSVISLSFNGTSEVDQPYSESFAATNILKIGSGYAKVFSGHFRRILFWPYHSDRL